MNKQEPRRGWLEVSYRISKTIPRNCQDIKQSDYMVVGGRLPLVEFDTIWGVYETFMDAREDTPRVIEPYDVITIFTQSPIAGRSTLIVLPPDKIPDFAWQAEGKYKCEILKSKMTTNVLLPLPYDHRFQTTTEQ